MSADFAKCSGTMPLSDREGPTVCSQRDRCERYSMDSGARQVWLLPTVLGYLCTEFVPTQDLGRMAQGKPSVTS